MISLFFAYQFATPALGVVTFLNANNQFTENRPFQVKTAEILSKEYDGKSTILLLAGAPQQNGIMQASGIPLKQFDPILESDSHKNSFQEPWIYAGYILMAKIPDSSAEKVVNYWLERQGLLNKYYRTIYENEYYMIWKLS
jgi:hypothetical protein